MRREGLIPVLALLLGVQLLLAWWLADPEEPPVGSTTNLLAFEVATVDAVEIADGEGGSVRLQLTDTGWRLPGHFDFPVPAERVAELLNRLAGLKPGLAVANSEEAAARFYVADTDFERRIRLLAGDRALAVLYLGEAAGPRRAYARVEGDRAIHPVEFTSLDAASHVGGWTDKAYLYQADEGLEAVSIGTLKLRRGSDGWRLDDLAGDEVMDAAKADALVQRLLRLNFMAVAGRAGPEPEGEVLLKVRLSYGNGRTVDYRFVDPGQQGDPLLSVSGLDHVLRIGSYVLKPLLETSRESLLAAGAD